MSSTNELDPLNIVEINASTELLSLEQRLAHVATAQNVSVEFSPLVPENNDEAKLLDIPNPIFAQMIIHLVTVEDPFKQPLPPQLNESLKKQEDITSIYEVMRAALEYRESIEKIVDRNPVVIAALTRKDTASHGFKPGFQGHRLAKSGGPIDWRKTAQEEATIFYRTMRNVIALDVLKGTHESEAPTWLRVASRIS
ncbi:MAG: hypothetical protein NVS1B7_6460 [Candidatus Saccharimonadales bacterium]